MRVERGSIVRGEERNARFSERRREVTNGDQIRREIDFL
jgi:hypothetical protein